MRLALVTLFVAWPFLTQLLATSAYAVKSDNYLVEEAYSEDDQIEMKDGPDLGLAYILFPAILEEGFTCLPEPLAKVRRGKQIVCTPHNPLDKQIRLLTTYTQVDPEYPESRIYSIFGIQVGKSRVNDPNAVSYFWKLVERARTHIKTPATQTNESPIRPSNAQNASYHYVANTRPPDTFLALRTHPSSRQGARIKSMPNHTLLQILQRRSDGWWNVRVIPTGEEGWTLSGQGNRRWIECCTTFDPANDSIVMTSEELAKRLSAYKNILAEVEVEKQTFQSSLPCHSFEYWLKQSPTELEVTLNCHFSYEKNPGESSVILRYRGDGAGTMTLVDKQYAG